jgi:hypothetical protein
MRAAGFPSLFVSRLLVCGLIVQSAYTEKLVFDTGIQYESSDSDRKALLSRHDSIQLIDRPV